MIAIGKEITSELNELMTEIKEKEERVKELKGIIQKEFENCVDEKTFSDEYIKATYVAETTSMSFDTKAFKKENPKAYEMFLKPSKKSAYVKITLVGEES